MGGYEGRTETRKKPYKMKHLGCRHCPWPYSNLSSMLRAELFYKTCLWSCLPGWISFTGFPLPMPPLFALSWSPGPGSFGSCLPIPPRLCHAFYSSSLNFQCPFLLPLKAAHFFCLSASCHLSGDSLNRPSSGALSWTHANFPHYPYYNATPCKLGRSLWLCYFCPSLG